MILKSQGSHSPAQPGRLKSLKEIRRIDAVVEFGTLSTCAFQFNEKLYFLYCPLAQMLLVCRREDILLPLNFYCNNRLGLL